MSNPYESPQGSYAPQAQPGFDAGGQRLGDSGYVRQVMVICILCFVFGGLEILVGIGAIFGGTFMSTVVEDELQRQPGGGANAAETQAFVGMISTIYFVAGIILIVAAVLRIAAGILNLKFRARALGITSFIVGVLPAFTFYCAPTAICLIVYGLIVYLNQDTVRAFALGQQGYTKEQILSAPRYG